MAGIADIRRDVTKEFKHNIGTSVLDESGRAVFGEVFNLTIGLFARNSARQKIAVWSSPKFRRFILGQTKKIAREASSHANNGIISGKVFNRAALSVMRRTQKHCKVKIIAGEIRDIPPTGHIMTRKKFRLDGDVCSVYLTSQDFA
jgi:hypothetical protein